MGIDQGRFEINRLLEINRARSHSKQAHDPFEHAPIEMGMEMFIDMRVGSAPMRPLQSKLVGYHKPNYLVITTPIINGKSLRFQETTPFMVYYVKDKVVYSFASVALRSMGPPFYMTVIKRPDKIEETSLRGAPRLRVGMLFDRMGGDPSKEFIMDLSATGALLKISQKMPVNSSLDISFYLPNGEAIDAIVCNVKRVDFSNDRMMVGVEFDPEHPAFNKVGRYINFVLGLNAEDEKHLESEEAWQNITGQLRASNG